MTSRDTLTIATGRAAITYNSQPRFRGDKALPMPSDSPPESAASQRAPRHPECPRCAYDLSGETARWETQCPLTGICSECGLAFGWRDVLHPRHSAPRWFIETSPRFRLWLIVRTWFASLVPARFWRDVKIENPISVRRLVVFGLVTACALYATCSAAAILDLITSYRMQGPRGLSITDQIAFFLAPDGPRPRLVRRLILPFAHGGRDTFPMPWLWIVVLWTALMPVSFFLLGTSLHRARVKRTHLLRGAIYTASTLPLAFLLANAAWFNEQSYWHSAFSWRVREYLLVIGRYVLVGTPALYALWFVWTWHAFVRRYLRLPHALGVAIAMAAMSGLASAVTAVLWHLVHIST